LLKSLSRRGTLPGCESATLAFLCKPRDVRDMVAAVLAKLSTLNMAARRET
jgi:hypothetical protein